MGICYFEVTYFHSNYTFIPTNPLFMDYCYQSKHSTSSFNLIKTNIIIMSTIHNTLIKNKIKNKNLEREWKGKRRKQCMFLVLDLVIQKFITVFQKFNAGFPIETGTVEQDMGHRSLFDNFLFWHAFRDMLVQKMSFLR